jgi:hypothetical protein
MIRLMLGLIFVLGAVGGIDSYDECLLAADCTVDGPPDWESIIGYIVIGLSLMAWAAYDMNKEYS